MAVLRSGKKTNDSHSTKKTISKSKAKQMILKYGIKECVVKINRMNVKQIENLRTQRYHLRIRTRNKNDVAKPKPLVMVPVTKQLAIASETCRIWKELTAQQYFLAPSVVVLAKMNSFRPWPARINTIYKVGDIYKCFVLFFGTFQIGSVSKSQCVSIKDCDLYLSNAVREIKEKFKWKLNYDKIAESGDNERSKQIVKLTQAQKFLLAIRDIEKLHNIPYELSLTKNDTC